MKGMNRERFERIEAIFERAVTLERAERDAYVREACGVDAALHAAVDALLAEDDRPLSSFVGLTPPPTDAQTVEVEPPRVNIDGFRVRRVIGRGGMGVVFEAEQERPRRPVAIKLIRGDLTSEALQRRFAFEADVLARLQHPSVARVYESGTIEGPAGPQPYLVMELVDGRPVTEWAEAQRLGTRERLELFARIGEAVHHAHLRGVIHRDIKPANILVDADGNPRVLDFGVARLVDEDARQASMRTRSGQVIGTLAYMSPEQLSGDPNATDIRADVYSLGVLLFELLTGALPVPVDDTDFIEAARRVRHDDPTRLSQFGRQLAGDLEAITGKALEKEPNRRYDSAASLVEDVRRHLADEPIVARPPSTIYRVVKFTRRHTAGVATGALLAVLLVAGTITTSVLAASESRARSEAELREQEAETSAAIAEAMNRFLVNDVLGAAAPFVAQGRELTVREAVDIATEKLAEGALADRPEVEASVQMTFARTRRQLGDLGAARSHVERALQLRADLGEDYRGPLAECYDELASLEKNAGNYEASERAYREAIAIGEAIFDDHDPHLATFRGNLAVLLVRLNRLDEGEELHRVSLAARRAHLDDDHPSIAGSLHNLAALLARRDKIGEADRLFAEAADIRRRMLGDSSPDLAMTIIMHAAVLEKLERYDESIAQLEEGTAILRRAFGDDHSFVGTAVSRQGAFYVATNDLVAAEARYAEALEIYQASLGPSHYNTALTHKALATVLAKADRPADALAHLERALPDLEAAVGDGHITTRSAQEELVRLLVRLEREAEAWERLDAFWRAANGGGDRERAKDLAGLGVELAREIGDGAAVTMWERLAAP